jgi:peptide/nickel transport system permease protein
MDVIAERIPYTLILVGTATVLAIIIGILLGAYAAWKRGGRVDTAVLSLSVVLHTLPTFWLGLIFLLLFAFFLPIFPLYGFGGVGIKDPVLYFLDVAWHCALPIITMTLTHFTSYALIMRNTVLTVLGEEFITAAKAFGLAERKILYGHVLRNAMLPMVTLIGLSIAGIFSGAILIETVFSWPGMGRLIVQSALWYDYPLMQAIFLLLAVITILANFAADLVYGLVDPRVKLR